MTRFVDCATLLLAISLLCVSLYAAAADAGTEEGKYAVVVSRSTRDDAAWKQVVEALVVKHRADLVVFDTAVAGSLERLRELFPRYTCFVATPSEATRQFVAEVHRLTRRLDDDPYTDTIWGILTGYDAANALRIARHAEPLTIGRVAAATEVELNVCRQGMWFCELVKNRMVRKEPGGKPKQLEGPDDTTKSLVDALNVYHAQLFVTSGHATQHDWQIGYRYRNGQFRCEGGRLYGRDTKGVRLPIDSPNPKLYMPVGNCLMGHIDGRDAMALAFLNSAGVMQMIGYTVPTWYGYAGWGCLDYFLEQPGRFTFAEAVFANHQALLRRLETYFPDAGDEQTDKPDRAGRQMAVSQRARRAGLSAHDGRGLLYDRDVLAFYGDPAWHARMAPGPLRWKQTLTEKDGTYCFEVTPTCGRDTFKPVSTNGSQRGGRPIVQLLPHRIKNVQILEGKELRPLVTDDFLLIPNPGGADPKASYRLVFRAEPVQ